MTDRKQKIQKEFEAVRRASRELVGLPEKTIKDVLLELSSLIRKGNERILEANRKDLGRMDPKDPKFDRLLLDEKRINGICSDLENVAGLPSPVGRVLEEKTLPNGLFLTKRAVPLGVVGVVFESRPNVTIDVFSLCFRSKNACVLKGGSDARDTNEVFVSMIQSSLEKHRVVRSAVYLMPSERDVLSLLLNAQGLVDLLIPRGGKGLIDYVRKNATVPVLETGAGIVHTYVDRSANMETASKIVLNAKTRRPSVCNALDTLLVHRERVSDLWSLVQPLAGQGVELRADEESWNALSGKYPAKQLRKASPEDFGTEFLSLKMSVHVVGDVEEAIDHICRYSSMHSEAIVATDEEVIERFFEAVDAACVYANTSTAFTDGAQFGMGAEIGISTQKLHARGPMALNELTTYKWLVRGNGQVRP